MRAEDERRLRELFSNQRVQRDLAGLLVNLPSPLVFDDPIDGRQECAIPECFKVEVFKRKYHLYAFDGARKDSFSLTVAVGGAEAFDEHGSPDRAKHCWASMIYSADEQLVSVDFSLDFHG